MESIPEEVWHHGRALRPVQAEQSGVKTWETQHFRQERGEGGAAQVSTTQEYSLKLLMIFEPTVLYVKLLQQLHPFPELMEGRLLL